MIASFGDSEINNVDRSNRRHESIVKIAAQSADIWSPYVSVVVPMYNSASILGDCPESIKNQDYRGEVEIIIADGGSTDSTLETAGKYTDKILDCNHIKVLYSQRGNTYVTVLIWKLRLLKKGS